MATARSTQAILDAAAAFLWSDETQALHNQFIARHVHSFHGASLDGEQNVEWQEIYLQFVDMYEKQLEDFCTSADVELADFVEACREALSHSTWQEQRGLATVVLAMAEYPYFISSMATAASDAAELPPEYGDDAKRGPVVLDEEEPSKVAPGDDLDGDFM